MSAARPPQPKGIKALAPRLASLRISVVCLALLLILTAWGTVYQAGNGLYAAQERFFHSWYFLIGGWIPFPGSQLVLSVLFVNLLASMIFRVKYTFANLGNIVTHSGLLFLLAGSFITYRYAQESYLPLAEKEMSNVSLDRRNWELAVWSDTQPGVEKKVSAVALSANQVGEEMDFSEFGIKAVVANFYRNCEPGSDPESGMPGMANAVGAGGTDKLIPRRPAQDPEDNTAGAILRIRGADGEAKPVVLYGGWDKPVAVATAKGPVRVSLRQLRHALPMTIKLIDVRKQDYPGTGIAKSYESDVEAESDGVKFKTRIYMNHPLHYHGFVFYQSSYSVNAQGKETSVFAVVENRGRMVPYISGGLIFGGMVLHFLLMLFGYGRRPGRRNGHEAHESERAPRRVNGKKTEVLK